MFKTQETGLHRARSLLENKQFSLPVSYFLGCPRVTFPRAPLYHKVNKKAGKIKFGKGGNLIATGPGALRAGFYQPHSGKAELVGAAVETWFFYHHTDVSGSRMSPNICYHGNPFSLEHDRGWHCLFEAPPR